MLNAKYWLISCFLILGLVAPSVARFPHGSLGLPAFTHVQIGGAGATMGVTSVPSANLLLIHADQYGCYMSVNNAPWVPLLTFNRMPAGSVTFSTSDGGPIIGTTQGCDTIAGDTLNPTNIWMGFNGNFYLSTNSGASFSTTCYPPLASGTSQVDHQATKTLNPTIAVDPANSNIVYMSTPSGSLQVTRNRGVSCAAAGGTLATPTTVGGGGGGYLIAFDPSAGTLTGASCPGSVSPCTKNIYVSVYGTGVYKSTDAGASWTLTTGTPTTHRYMAMGASTGVLWFVDDTYNGGGFGGNAKKFDGTTWTTPTFINSSQSNSVAVDPNACASAVTCHVVFLEIGGPSNQAFTTDGGSTAWVKSTSVTVVSSDVPWIAPSQTSFQTGAAAFDNSGHVYLTGEGMFWFTPITSPGALTVNSQTAGIEEFLTNRIVTSVNTSGMLLAAGWDVGCFVLTAPYNTFPGSSVRTCTNSVPVFYHAYDLDWVAGSPSTFVSLADNQLGYGGGVYASYSAISIDKGATWTNFSPPAAISSGGLKGGCLAASSATNWVIAPTDGSGGNVAPYYTINAGGAWTQISVSGVTGGWPFTFTSTSHQCAADRVTPNTFYFYNWNTGSGGDAIIKCTASGATCTIGARPGLGPNQQFNPNIKTVPGQADTFFLAAGPVTLGEELTGNGFYYSTNGGTTLNTIANVTTVSAFGFGAVAPGHTFPTIVFAGYLNHVYGLYQSIDWDGAKTWQNIGTYPLNIPLAIYDIDGDKSAYNVFYYGTGSGVFCSAQSSSQCNGGT